MKQTAVEWLFEKLPTIDKYDPYYANIITQAKEMEKEQIIEAWIVSDNPLQRIEAEKYYNITYQD